MRKRNVYDESMVLLFVPSLTQTYVCLQVVFKKPVDLKQNPKVNEWLTCVENEMRTSLAILLASAVKEIQQFNSADIDSKEYMGWVDKYQVLTQIYTNE